MDKKLIGKKARAAGQRFELKVRKDLESKGWIVDKWSNNVELLIKTKKPEVEVKERKYETKLKITTFDTVIGKLVKVKNKWAGPGRPMMLGAGFPDFIAFKLGRILIRNNGKHYDTFDDFQEENVGIAQGIDAFSLKEQRLIIGVESKMNGKLDKQEKEKCKWYLKNNIFSKILIAKKGAKRGQIEYVEFNPKV